MDCPKCGFENLVDARFCSKCGAAIHSSDETSDFKTATLQIPTKELARGIVFAERYEVIEKLGKGGMGLVYRVFDKKIEEEVALKLLKPEIARDENTIARFRNELKFARRISHRNVCRMYDFSEGEGTQYITMEYVRGEVLKSLIKRLGRLSEEKAVSTAKQVCEGLIEAHQKGVVHRDLKPHNIMIDTEGNVRILDFGIARSLRTKGTTEVGIVVGTPEYISPEQVEAEEIDQRSDIYSLGIILFEMVTGRVPFEGDTPLSVVFKQKTEIPPDPREFNDEVSEDLCRVILKCMEKDREKRYQAADELIFDLRNIEEGIPITAAPAKLHIPVFLMGREDEDEIEAPVFVARERELAKLEQNIEKAVAGKGQVFFVSGEAGSGKTALIHEFAKFSQEKHTDLVAAYGNCNAHSGVADPYLPFREVLCMLTGEVEAKWAAGAITREQAARLWNILPLSVDALVYTGQELIGTFMPGVALVKRAEAFAPKEAEWLARLKRLVERKALSPGASKLLQSDLFEEYTRVLQSLMRRQPLLLILDDLQWADSGSISLLSYLIRRIGDSRILIICAYRPSEVLSGRNGERHPLESLLNEFKREFDDTGLELGQAEDREFVDALLDTEPNRLGTEFRETLNSQTRGHPLFTIELLRNMQEQKMLVQDEDGNWIEGLALDWDRLPARVEAVVGERLGRLPEKLREILTVASIEGEEFTAEVIARIQGSDELDVVRLLSRELDKRYRIVNARGIQQIMDQRLSKYCFRHILFQKYLYSSLDEVERTYLHERAGTVLEELYGELSKEIAVQLVRHFREAGVVPKQIKYLEKAGELALNSYASQEALYFLNEAIALDTRMEPSSSAWLRAHWEHQLGKAYMGLGRIAESRKHLERALAILDRPLPATRWRLVLNLLRQAMRQILHRVWSARFVGRSKDASATLLEAVRAYEQIAEICYFSQEKVMSLYAALRALNVAECAGPSPELGRNYAHMCMGAGVLSLHALARKYSRLAQEIAQKVDPFHTLGDALLMTALYNLGIGHWAKVEEAIRDAINIFHVTGDWRRWEECLTTEAILAFFQGEFARSTRVYDILYKSASRRGDVQVQCWGLARKELSQLHLGKVEEPSDTLKALNFGALLDELRLEKMLVYAVLALARLRQNKLESAQKAAEEAMQLFAQSAMRTPLLLCYSCVAEVFLRLWEAHSNQPTAMQQSLAKSALKACKALKRFARVFPIGRPNAWLWRGLYDWLSGNHGRALKAWKKSIANARQLGMPYEEGMANYEIGRHSKGRRRQEHLSSASEIFSRLGNTYGLSRVKAEL